MNAKQLIAAVAVFAATGSAFAAEWVDFTGVPSTKTRAEVIAELNDAQAQGAYIAGGQEYAAPDAKFASSKTRAQVMAELKQSQEDGSYALAHQEYDGQFPALNNGATASRLARSGKPTNAHYN